VYAFSSDKQVKQNLEPTHVQPAISSPKFDKTETLLAAVLLGGEEKPEDFFLICRARITGTPHDLENIRRCQGSNRWTRAS
jgi:hypothetical protein